MPTMNNRKAKENEKIKAAPVEKEKKLPKNENKENEKEF
jgi:hypothetical protein